MVPSYILVLQRLLTRPFLRALVRACLTPLIISLLVACDRQSDSQLPPTAPTLTPVTELSSPGGDETPVPQQEGEALADLLQDSIPADGEPDIEPALILVPTTEPVLGQEASSSAQIAPSRQSTETVTVPTVLGRVTAALVNVRSAPGYDASVVTTAAGGTEVTVLEASPDGGWLLVCCIDGREGNQWIKAEFIETQLQVASSAQDLTETGAPSALVSADLVNIRGGPGTNFQIVTQVNRGQALTILAKTESGDWLRVCCVSADPTVESWLSTDFLESATPGDLATAEVPVESGPAAPAISASAVGGSVSVAPAAAAPAPGLPAEGGFGAPGGANPFTGQPLSGSAASRRPVIVCINNDYAARPQLGISQADVMYEYLMEGFGITRFSGIFYGDDVSQIGPIRSARLINYYLGALYNAGLVCSGASDPVRYTLKHEAPFPYLDIDLDDPSNSRYSASVGSDYRTRLRIATAGLLKWLGEWGAAQPASVRGFTFGDSPGGGASASQVLIPYPSGTGSQVAYQFDGSRYRRSLGGAPHLDGNSGSQVGVDNVIVQYVPHEVTDIVEDSLGSLSIRLNLFGSGRAVVFRDGQAFEGTWRSDSRGDLPRFYASDGSEIRLKPGRSWISVVPADYTISYQ